MGNDGNDKMISYCEIWKYHQMDYVSLVNLWCQKNKKQLPNYVFKKDGDMWESMLIAPWVEDYMSTNSVQSGRFQNQKLAKQEAAKILHSKIKKVDSLHISPEETTCLLIDGDQRGDVINWLLSENITWDKKLNINVYASPLSSVKETDQFRVKFAKSSNKDSADALMLMDIGKMLFLNQRNQQKVIIVSKDHILEQAAKDNDLLHANDLESLKALLRS